MKHTLLVLASISLGSCTLAVSDLNNLGNSADACDPRGAPRVGQDLDIQFFNTVAHVNQDMRFAVEVGPTHSVEAMFVVSAFDDPNLRIIVPEVLPSSPATLAFWADVNGSGMLDANAHQWFRPICPDGQVTFTHTTPFQDVSVVSSHGATFVFHIPVAIQRHAVFDNFRVAMWAVQTDMVGRQTRVYYEWAPFVAPSPGFPVPAQRTPPTQFQVGRNVAGAGRGAIDMGGLYEIHFVIDSNHDTDFEPALDFSCVWPMQRMPTDPTMTMNGAQWDFVPDLSVCDRHGFDPTTVAP